MARQRYLLVDRANRLVADALEADWNHKLRARADAQDHYDLQRQADSVALDEAQRQEILQLATDFPAVWQDLRTPPRERKRMAALLLEDVPVLRGEQVTLYVRFRGGTATTLTVPRPLTAWERRRTSPAVLTTIDALLTDHTDARGAPQRPGAHHRGRSGLRRRSRQVATRRQGAAEFSPPPGRPTYSPPRNSPVPGGQL